MTLEAGTVIQANASFGPTAPVGQRPPWITPEQWAEYQRVMQSLVTEDDQPVDNIFSAKQQSLLVDALYTSWSHPEAGKRFLALANVGVFYSLYAPPVVPDFLLSVGVEPLQDVWQKEGRSYFTWIYGKAPDVVVEIVSNREGGELDRKAQTYANIGVRYYVVYDPQRWVSEDPLRLMVNVRGAWQVAERDALTPLGLSVTLWEGNYEGIQAMWLRWCDAEGRLLLIGRELAEVERQRAERLAAKLRALGIDPDA
ncbi:MAG: Uma2 family endonuclease [Thermoflexales bacterium]|nr:Uma2 family endonuclease [Thermoflexales bacterium]MCS7324943.1 Uma2 family endonuclease [Thermoflexales bacterium]MCX7938077.1 Uma2 family endonuclease [Thermoflexales bacterium]MDW8054296.1 Uma2 family endonuclease [Anaerolineae bacterium]MDW8291542.1 Uma2 family endonuclease [Anaerolineae bacterium]